MHATHGNCCMTPSAVTPGIYGSQSREDYSADDVEHYFNYMGMLAIEVDMHHPTQCVAGGPSPLHQSWSNRSEGNCAYMQGTYDRLNSMLARAYASPFTLPFVREQGGHASVSEKDSLMI